MPQYRKGISNATTPERVTLLEAELLARTQAVESVVAELCARAPYGLADCPELAVWASSIRWFRHQRRLYIIIRVVVGPPKRIVTFRWRTPMRGASGGYSSQSRGPGKLGRGADRHMR